MLTYIDKFDYKHKNNMSFTKGEKYFFSYDEIRKILRKLNKKRFYHKKNKYASNKSISAYNVKKRINFYGTNLSFLLSKISNVQFFRILS